MSEKKLVIFIDSGDTIVDEKTEILDDQHIVVKADLIPGAGETIKKLKELGYKVYMVADGLRQSFINVHTQHGLYDLYDGHIYSEDVGVYKPHPKMFEVALEAAGLTKEDVSRIIMVGNNLSRDVKGANDMGMTSVHIHWNDRYPSEATDKSEIPHHVIKEPHELIELAEKLNKELEE